MKANYEGFSILDQMYQQHISQLTLKIMQNALLFFVPIRLIVFSWGDMQVSVDVEDDQQSMQLRASSSVVSFPGFLAVYKVRCPGHLPL